MPLGPNGFQLTEDELARWLLEDFPFPIDIAAEWPFRGIKGAFLRFASTNALTPAQAIDFCVPIAENTAQPISPPKSFGLGELATNFQICYSAADRFAYPNDLQAVEDAMAIRQLLYLYFFLLDQGNSAVAGQFDSLLRIADPSKVLNLAGAIPTLANYDDVYFRVDDNEAHPTAIMSNRRAFRQFRAQNYAAGFLPLTVMHRRPDPIRGVVDVPWSALHGTKWYINDMIPTRLLGPDNVSNIYFMVMGDHGEPGPGHGVTGIVPEPKTQTMFSRRETYVSGAKTVDWTWPVGVAVGSKGALAVMQDARVL